MQKHIILAKSIKYLWKNRKMFIISFFLSLLGIFLYSVKMLLVYELIDNLFKNGNLFSIKIVIELFSFLFLFFLSTVNEYYIIPCLKNEITKEIRRDFMISCMGRMGLKEENYSIGNVLSLHDSFVPEVADNIVHNYRLFFSVLSIVVINITVFCQMNSFMIIPIFVLFFLAIAIEKITQNIPHYVEGIQKEKADINEYVEDSINNIISIKTLNLYNIVIDRLKMKFKALFKEQIHFLKVETWVNLLNEMSYFLSQWLLPISSVLLIVFGKGNVALLAATMIITPSISEMFILLSNTILEYQKNRKIYKKVFEMVGDPITGDFEVTHDLSKKEGIFCQNVELRNEDKILVHEVNFEAEKGKLTVICGKSGSGKTTLVSLIESYRKIEKGKIILNVPGRDEFKIIVLRTDPFLLKGTLIYNFHIFCQLDENEAINAINNIDCYFGTDFSDNNRKDIGEKGENLSSGQRKIICYAMAILARPDFLVLDEPTANLDKYTAGLLIEHIKRMKDKITILVVSHNRDLIDSADTVVNLNEDIVGKNVYEDKLF